CDLLETWQQNKKAELAGGHWLRSLRPPNIHLGSPLRAVLSAGSVNSVAVSPDGLRLASGSYGTVRIWDIESGVELQTLKGHRGAVNGVVFAPDGKRLASGSDDLTIRIWDAENGAELACLCGHQEKITSVVFSPDGKRAASGSDDNTLRVWDME